SGGPGSVRQARGASAHRSAKRFGQQHTGARRRIPGPHWPGCQGGDSSAAPSPQRRHRRSPQRGGDSLEKDRGWRIEDRGSIKKSNRKEQRTQEPNSKNQEPMKTLEFGAWNLVLGYTYDKERELGRQGYA